MTSCWGLDEFQQKFAEQLQPMEPTTNLKDRDLFLVVTPPFFCAKKKDVSENMGTPKWMV